MPPNKPPLPDKELAVFKKYYVHRIGRTGRAGASGISISLISEDDAFNLPALEEFLGHPVVCTQPEL